ncbi:hypothetical protein [Ornithinimicrobium pratense]|uniref:Uncharacterized protein n=1 Tax=Ornithinimicrobium pratense TaxID=2593973 RepID=A0A5J6V1M0_9MICO|nr:hypothetical protein [Ornithinimicrobium pratense]QFG67689.1 hypothetical protein FY030_02155 [Ornithinimicrobium pratense]
MTNKTVERDAATENAAEILGDLKAKGGRFREVETDWSFPASRRIARGSRCVCPCAGDQSGNQRLLARTVTGRADDVQGIFTWLWVAGHSTPKKKVPPSAVALYDGQDAHRSRTLNPLVVTCPRCRVSYFLFPGYFPNIAGLLNLPSPADGGPQNVLTPGIVNVLISDGSGHYDRRIAEG